MPTTPDRIEKEIVLRASPARVWRAISDPTEFGAWFGVSLEGEFVPGARPRGKVTLPGYEHMTMEIEIERTEPERLLSFRWHPHAIDPDIDYSGEPTTLVEFRLEEHPQGTRLTITESGFDGIPGARRAESFLRNEGGWEAQLENIEKHVSPE